MVFGKPKFKISTRAEENIFEAVNVFFMALVVIISVYPFLNILVLSFSSTSTIGLSLIPKGSTVENYLRVFRNDLLWVGLKNSVIRVIVGTGLSLVVMTMFAYALSKKDLPLRKFLTIMVLITMFFNGGLIPNYILVRNLGLMNNIGALVLPNLVDSFALIVMRNYFMALPAGLEESAKIDGAGYFKTLAAIVVPISKPILATVVLWRAVWHWNAWFDVMLYIKSYGDMTLQYILRRIVIEGASDAMNAMMESVTAVIPPENIKAASIIFSTVPILMVYPFLQRYFVKGVMVGSLKG